MGSVARLYVAAGCWLRWLLAMKQLAAGNEAGWGHDCYTAIGIQRGGMLRQCFVGMVVARLFGLH